MPTHLGPFQTRVPKALLDLLGSAACYHGDQRWSLLYEVLWRVSHGDRTAMLAGDKPFHLRAYVRTMLYVPPSMKILDLLARMRAWS